MKFLAHLSTLCFLACHELQTEIHSRSLQLFFPDLLRWFEFLCGACPQRKDVQGQTSAMRIPFALACNPGCRL